MYAERLPAFGIGKNVDTVEGVRMHWGHDATRVVSSNRNQAQIKRSSKIPYLLEPKLILESALLLKGGSPSIDTKGYRELFISESTQTAVQNKNTLLRRYTYAGQCGKLYFSS